MSCDVAGSAADLAFRARALAQTHPLSAAVYRIVNRVVADEGRFQPMAAAGVWAGAALTQGYCVRRVQEASAGVEESVVEWVSDEALERAASNLVAEIRGGLVDENTVAALDLLIGSQVDSRIEQCGDGLDPTAIAELEQYFTWWVVKGYALRQAETIGSIRPCDC